MSLSPIYLIILLNIAIIALLLTKIYIYNENKSKSKKTKEGFHNYVLKDQNYLYNRLRNSHSGYNMYPSYYNNSYTNHSNCNCHCHCQDMLKYPERSYNLTYPYL